MDKWEKEFEADMYNLGYYDGGVDMFDTPDDVLADATADGLQGLVEKYLGVTLNGERIKVKVKCSKGTVLIERI